MERLRVLKFLNIKLQPSHISNPGKIPTVVVLHLYYFYLGDLTLREYRVNWGHIWDKYFFVTPLGRMVASLRFLKYKIDETISCIEICI